MPICRYEDYDRDAKPFPDLLYNVNPSTLHCNSRVHYGPIAQLTSLPALPYYTTYQLFPSFHLLTYLNIGNFPRPQQRQSIFQETISYMHLAYK